MGRIRSRATSAQPADLSTSSPMKQPPHKRKKKNGYKVVLESVTQKRKKLRLSATFDQNPPPGYTFVGFGDARLTAQCKEFCRKRGELAYSVSAPPKNNATADPEKISFHVNRLGFYFPNKIVDLATEWLGITIAGARPGSKNGSGFTQGLGRRLKAYVDLSEEDRVRAAMRDLFPKMPEESLEAIVEHAFAEGAKRVGNATNLSLERRVQMAVLAHVRHKHTDYDKLLKEVGYIQARKTVENPCIEKILTWRGENASDDEEVVEMEDDFREVIVLDDSDDNDERSDDDGSDSESSVEYAPGAHVSVRHQQPGRNPTSGARAPLRARPKSLIEPIIPQRLGYDRLQEGLIPYRTTYPHEAAQPRTLPRGYVRLSPVERNYDPQVRLVAYDASPSARSHILSGHRAPEVSGLYGNENAMSQAYPSIGQAHTHEELSQQRFVSRRVPDHDPHGDVQLVQVARFDSDPVRGHYVPHHLVSGRPDAHDRHGYHAVDRTERDIPFRGEPRPEDVIVPSIEKDEPGSVNSPMSIDSHPYISRQERSLMQVPPTQGHGVPHTRRRVEPEEDRTQRVPQGNFIDLTDSPARAPRNIPLGRDEPFSVSAYDTGRMQSSNHSTNERYHDRRPIERIDDHKTRMVGKFEPSIPFFLGLPEQIEGRHDFEDEKRIALGRGFHHREHTGMAGGTRSNACPPECQRLALSLSKPPLDLTNKQIRQSIPSKRRSGDFIVEEPAAYNERPAYSMRRRLDEQTRAPGRVLGTLDSPSLSHGPRAPVAAERLVREPHIGHENPTTSSPARMMLSRAYEDVQPIEIPAWQGPSSGIEHRSPASAHYYDYRPAHGNSRSYEDLARAYPYR